jgi:hypothetical protein
MPHAEKPRAHERGTPDRAPLLGRHPKWQSADRAGCLPGEPVEQSADGHIRHRQAAEEQLVGGLGDAASRQARVRKGGEPAEHGGLVGDLLRRAAVEIRQPPVGCLHNEPRRDARE